VIVKNGQIIGEGYHHRAGEPHAEINALKQAGANAAGSTVYVTLEPCSHTGRTPPCANALIESAVRRVVVAMVDPNPVVAGEGIRRLRDAGIEVTENVLGASALALNKGFCKRMRNGLPYVRVKMAMSLDGRTAMSSGESKWITGPDARADVHRMRALSGAIMTGSGTVLADDPSMDFRLDEYAQLSGDIPQDTAQPLKVIVDSELKTPLTASILGHAERVMIATVAGSASSELFSKAGITVNEYESTDGKVPLKELLADLANQEINDVMVEAGPGLAGALLGEKLVDELVIYMAPHIMGDTARGLFTLPGLDSMRDRLAVRIDDIRAIGNDWKIIATPEYA
jgi:diaminohydroxyphosphoribosylaminopyrimidine deaminase/5-amino-6-(5-phosphoribosylamino)uracil reductase